VQKESFSSIAEMSAEWKREMDHFPGISPVSVNFRLGDGYRWRTIHPVLGTPRMHNGQDFEVPYGTEVYATGDGKVIESGWNTGGFGNCIVIDHGYGLQTVYGHLSDIKIANGQNVKRGDLIGISEAAVYPQDLISITRSNNSERIRILLISLIVMSVLKNIRI